MDITVYRVFLLLKKTFCMKDRGCMRQSMYIVQQLRELLSWVKHNIYRLVHKCIFYDLISVNLPRKDCLKTLLFCDWRFFLKSGRLLRAGERVARPAISFSWYTPRFRLYTLSLGPVYTFSATLLLSSLLGNGKCACATASSSLAPKFLNLKKILMKKDLSVLKAALRHINSYANIFIIFAYFLLFTFMLHISQ